MVEDDKKTQVPLVNLMSRGTNDREQFDLVIAKLFLGEYKMIGCQFDEHNLPKTLQGYSKFVRTADDNLFIVNEDNIPQTLGSILEYHNFTGGDLEQHSKDLDTLAVKLFLGKCKVVSNEMAQKLLSERNNHSAGR